MVENLDTLHGAALHADAVWDDLAYRSTDYLVNLRRNIHSYTGPDTSGLNAVFASRLDELLAKRS